MLDGYLLLFFEAALSARDCNTLPASFLRVQDLLLAGQEGDQAGHLEQCPSCGEKRCLGVHLTGYPPLTVCGQGWGKWFNPVRLFRELADLEWGVSAWCTAPSANIGSRGGRKAWGGSW